MSAYPAGLLLAGSLLTVRDAPERADVIVVLGGDGPVRAKLATNLWLKGVAPRVLVSGNGDCNSIRRTMIAGGVDERAIMTECHSKTTWQNALFSAPILKEMNPRRAVLVTSWYHSKRAVSCFKALNPGMDWLSVPVELNEPYYRLAFDRDGMQVFKEYPKTIWYGLCLFLLPLMQKAGPLHTVSESVI
jgi:uncharacterized SAM-binding protein YcdF (DUF218 family)